MADLVAVALVVPVAAASPHVLVAAVAAMPVVPVAAPVVPVVPVVAPVVPVVDVQVLAVVVRRPVHSVVPVVSRHVDVRVSVPSAKSSTTCPHHHPRVRFGPWVRGRLFACPVARA